MVEVTVRFFLVCEVSGQEHSERMGDVDFYTLSHSFCRLSPLFYTLEPSSLLSLTISHCSLCLSTKLPKHSSLLTYIHFPPYPSPFLCLHPSLTTCLPNLPLSLAAFPLSLSPPPSHNSPNPFLPLAACTFLPLPTLWLCHYLWCTSLRGWLCECPHSHGCALLCALEWLAPIQRVLYH